jgi:monoamine oxidase
MDRSIIIIGAGAAGLQAGRRLSKAGFTVTILEANAQPGGRILTIQAGGPDGFSLKVEGGAEFIHGDLPLSLELAKEADVILQPVHSDRVHVRADHKEEAFGQGWDELFKQMEMLTADMPFSDFLAAYFSGDQYTALRESVSRMAEGYDLADLRTASTLSLYREWTSEEDGGGEYRPVGGYRRLIDHLVEVCLGQGCVVRYSSPVVSVSWERGRVIVQTASGLVYTAARLVSTVSLGVLKDTGIAFSPELPADRLEAIRKLGFGSVIKVLLEFDQPFWSHRKQPGHTLFLISEEALPTWWTQSEDDCPLITGWIAGKKRDALRVLDKEARITAAVGSLAAIFEMDPAVLRARLRASLILDWALAPAVHGGYSFDTVGAQEARAVLAQPVAETLFFSGEGLYEGDMPGTVEAAFCSGVTVAEKIIAQP